MFFNIKFRRKRLIILYIFLFLIIIAFKTHDFEDKKCVNLLISNDIKLKPFVANNESQQTTDPKWSLLIDNRISVYSAFLFKDSLVRIASAVDQDLWTAEPLRIECHFMPSANSAVKFKSLATLRVLEENYQGEKTYAASEIKCVLPREHHSTIRYVAISLGTDMSRADYRPILELLKAQSYLYSNDTISDETVLCVRPVFKSTHLLSSVVEFFAYYRANDINRFVFYDLDIDEELKSFLTSLEFVEIIPFKLTFNETLIHAFGQRASIQDCLMRYSHSAIIFVDFDEFIVIQEKKSTLQSLIKNKMEDKTLSSFTINNRFLCHEFQTSHTFPMILSHNRIQTYHWRSGDRSKMIVLRPDTVIDSLIHRVTETQKGYHSEELGDNEVLLYHYRSCCGMNQEFVHFEHLNLYFKTLSDKNVEDFRIKWFEIEIRGFIDQYVLDYYTSSHFEIGTNV